MRDFVADFDLDDDLEGARVRVSLRVAFAVRDEVCVALTLRVAERVDSAVFEALGGVERDTDAVGGGVPAGVLVIDDDGEPDSETVGVGVPVCVLVPVRVRVLDDVDVVDAVVVLVGTGVTDMDSVADLDDDADEDDEDVCVIDCVLVWLH